MTALTDVVECGPGFSLAELQAEIHRREERPRKLIAISLKVVSGNPGGTYLTLERTTAKPKIRLEPYPGGNPPAPKPGEVLVCIGECTLNGVGALVAAFRPA